MLNTNYSAGFYSPNNSNYWDSTYSQRSFTNEDSIIGTLIFPGRKSVLPASTVPEYPAQPYPVLNLSSSARALSAALGDSDYSENNLLFGNYSNSYSAQSNLFSSYNDEETDLSFFNPRPLANPFGNQIPFNNASVLDGLFGNIHGTTSIIARFAGDTMPTDKDSAGYTWKYTVPEQNQIPNYGIDNYTDFETVETTDEYSDYSQDYEFNSDNVEEPDLSYFNPRPLADPLGNQIPFNNASVLDGLFGNIHGVTSIIARFAGDIMPTDKDSAGYTWKYTVPGG